MTQHSHNHDGDLSHRPHRSFATVAALGFAALAFSLFGGTAHAVLTTLSYSPPADALRDLSGTSAYTWRLDNIPSGLITEATLTFSNIANGGTAANRLFGHLFDSSTHSGVASFVDNPDSRLPMADLTDDFANTRHHSSPDWLVAPGTGDTKLFGKSFTGTPESWTYTFNEAELKKLNQYASDGTLAFGFDSDSRYFNQGVTFSVRFAAAPPAASPIPEANAVLPLGGVLLMAVAMQSRARRRAATLPA